MTPQQLINATVCNRDIAPIWAKNLTEAMDEFEINTPLRQAAFIATVAHESNKFKTLAENLFYSAEGLLKTFPKYFDKETAVTYAKRPMSIANRVYANRMGNGNQESGDGWKYRGKGPIQITGKDNHRTCGNALGIDLIKNPILLLDFPNSTRSSAWFFSTCGAIKYADEKDFDGVCDIINRGRKTAAVGDSIGWDNRRAYYNLARTVF